MPTSFKKLVAKQKKRYRAFMARRPHRSFRMTRRRDYVRPFELPGNISFTHEVTKTLWKNKNIFLEFVTIDMVLMIKSNTGL